jgi:hypothetical protein
MSARGSAVVLKDRQRGRRDTASTNSRPCGNLRCQTSMPSCIRMEQRAVWFVTKAFGMPVCRRAMIEDPDNNHVATHKRHA